MNFLNLEYFLVAAEELNFTKAAKRLYISQQSLSNHISKLESYYEAILFDRNPPLSLTNEGLCLVEHAKKILSIRDESKKEISDIRDFDGGDIIIGTPRTWGRIILPQVL
ncbi:MAG: LysR family transcriptional regulator, partial [Oscillospiraceae bacterium]